MHGTDSKNGCCKLRTDFYCNTNFLLRLHILPSQVRLGGTVAVCMAGFLPPIVSSRLNVCESLVPHGALYRCLQWQLLRFPKSRHLPPLVGASWCTSHGSSRTWYYRVSVDVIKPPLISGSPCVVQEFCLRSPQCMMNFESAVLQRWIVAKILVRSGKLHRRQSIPSDYPFAAPTASGGHRMQLIREQHYGSHQTLRG